MTSYTILVAGMQYAGLHDNRGEAELALREFREAFPGTADGARLIPLHRPTLSETPR
jgi:hypothetical protein